MQYNNHSILMTITAIEIKLIDVSYLISTMIVKFRPNWQSSQTWNVRYASMQVSDNT